MEIRNVVMSIVSITVGILLVGSLLAPNAAQVMDDLDDLPGGGGWASLVGVTVVMVIISLVLIAVLGFSAKKQRTWRKKK